MAQWTTATRKAYYAEHPENFAGPNMTYPIKDRSDVADAWGLAGQAAAPDAVRAKIKTIAKRLGFADALPDTAKESLKESAPPALSPRDKIATLTTCFLEDDAISLNGRQYPREAVDTLIRSAQVHLSAPGADPLTCYISHDAADQDDSLKLVGKITNVWREANKAMATIDLADTHAGRDVAYLAAHKYLVTQSLRASNAEVKRVPGSTWPLIGGASLRLDGIDFTATPGIQVARIHQVALTESAIPQKLYEVFNAHKDLLLLQEQEGTAMPKIIEADQGGNTVGGYAPTSGDSPSMTSDPTYGSYHQRMYKQPPMTGGPMQGMEQVGSAIDVQEAHDRIALVQNRMCAPGRESARWKLAFAGLAESERKLVEAGRSLSSKNDAHLDMAHHAVARHLGMECEGKNNKMPAMPANDGLGDGDSDDRQSVRPRSGLKEQQSMNPEEAAKLLEAAGYKIEKPKSEAEQLREQLAALKAEQDQRLEEMRTLIGQQQPNPQRKSLVLGATPPAGSGGKANVYQPGKYLKEQIASADWGMLADRTAPLPEKIDVSLLIREFTDLRVVQNFDRYGWPENLATVMDRL